MIDRVFDPPAESDPADTVDTTIEVEIVPDEDAGFFPEELPAPAPPPFDSNLAEFMQDDELSRLAYTLVEEVDRDRRSRADWERALKDGIDYLGIKFEDRARPWAGACGVYHPILLEAVVRFQSQAIAEIFPAAGPVKTAIIGKCDREVEEQSFRVQQDMNYWLTKKMSEYRDETEQLLFSLALAGSAFRKIYRDEVLGRPVAMFVPAEDFIMPYGYTRLETCPRYTHVMKKDDVEIRKLQFSGYYREIEVQDPVQIPTDIERKVDSITGMVPVELNTTGLHTLYEIHVDLDLAGFEHLDSSGQPSGIALPYVVTVEKDSLAVLSIRRNWAQDDPSMQKRMHFVHYRYIPGLGAYGFGLVHLIGGITKGSTSILRQLIDAGTLANLPAGFKSKDLRVKGDNTPLLPGEWRDVDTIGSTMRDSFFSPPYKEPSQALYSLMENLIDEGRRFASIADLQVGEGNQQAPVGTTLALIERSMKVMSAIQARLHAAQRNEFDILVDLIRAEGDQYEYDPATGKREDKVRDYDSRVDVLPVADPNAASMGQRILQAQAALQLAAQSPELYDLPKLHRFMLTAMGVDNPSQLVPDEEDVKPTDPVSENIQMMKGKPVKVFIWQDHRAHITVHASMMQSKEIGTLLGQSQTGAAIKAAIDTHIAEHMAYAYRDEVERMVGTPLPVPGDEMSPQIERNLAGLMAEGAKRAVNAQKIQADAAAAQQAAQDPVIQLQREEMKARLMEAQAKAQDVQARAQIEQAKLQVNTKLEQARLQLEQARVENAAKLDQQRLQLEQTRLQAGQTAKMAQLQVEKQLGEERIQSEMQRAADDREAEFAKEAVRSGNGGGSQP